MAWYMIRNDGGSNIGTATGDGGRYTSKPTGTWPASTSAYYGTLEAAFAATTSPGDGDFFLFANDHNESTELAGNRALNGVGQERYYISVDVTDVEEYLPGAVIANTDNLFYWQLSGDTLFAGMTWKNTGNNDVFAGTNEGFIRFIDCLVWCNHTNTSQWAFAQLGGSTWTIIVECINTEVKIDANGGKVIRCQYLSRFIMHGGKVTHGTGGGNVTFDGSNGSAFELYGVDLRTCLLPFTLNGETCINKLDGCILDPSVSIASANTRRTRLEMFGCDDTTNNSQHRFLVKDGMGQARNNDSCYVTNTDAWFGGSDKSSIEVITTADCTSNQPFVFDIPAQIIDLSAAASDVITLEMVTDGITLNDTEFVAMMLYPDGTQKVGRTLVSSSGNLPTGAKVVNPYTNSANTLATGSLGASDWTGEPASPTFYKVVLDTSTDAGSLAAVSVRIEIAKASIGTGKLFIHPLLLVS